MRAKLSGVLSEQDGRIVLREAFEAQGYAIQENYRLRVGEAEVELDGFDPQARIGYEYLTSEDGIEPEVVAELLRIYPDYRLFLMDEEQVPDAGVLLEAVFGFFRELES